MTWFNGMVEFLVILVNGVNGRFWEIVTKPMHGCLHTPLIEGSGHHVVHG